MVQPGEPETKGKAAVDVESSERGTEYQCPRCFKTFHSSPALCGHQNAHRLVKDPMKMSPVLAAVLNNPLPPFHKPFLIPPRPKPGLGGANRAASKVLISKQPTANLSPHYHPYRRLDEEPNQLLRNEPRYRRPYETVVPEYNNQEEYTVTDSECLTMDLLGEWMPISGFGDDGHLGTSSGQMLTHRVSRNYPMEMEREADLELGLSTFTGSTGHLDLELKLGF